MAPISQQIAGMVNLLPRDDQTLVLELVKKMVLAWDPDYTKLTPAERESLEQAEAEMNNGEYVTDEKIDWG